MSNEVLGATTSASTSEFGVAQGESVTASASGLGAEVVAIEHKRGSNFVPARDYATGTAIELTADSDMVKISSPGIYRFNKPVTASPTSLHLDKFA